MSTENVVAFLRKIETDAAMQAKAERAQAAQMEAIAKLAAELGTPFTPEEYGRVVKSLVGDGCRDLEELGRCVRGRPGKKQESPARSAEG